MGLAQVRAVFVALANSSEFRRVYADDPRSALVAMDLSDEEIEAFVSGDDRLTSLFAAAQRDAGLVARPAEAPVAPAAAPAAAPPPAPPPLAFTIRVDPTVVTDADGAVRVELGVSVHGTPHVPPATPLRAVPASPSGHHVGTPEVAAAAAAASAARGRDVDEATRVLIAALTDPSRVPPLGPAHPPRPAAGEVRVHVVGLGITAGAQLTPEVEEALSDCATAFVLDSGLGVPEVIGARGPAVVDLFASTYREGEDRAVGYRRIAATVVAAALASDRPVALAIHGHPTVFSYPARLVADACDALGLPVRIWPGVSAIDTVLAELRVDPSVHGLVMFEATDLLLRDRALPIDVPALVWQVGMTGSTRYSAAANRPERLRALQRLLEQSHGPDHPITAVFTAPHPVVPTARIDLRIGELMAHAAALHAGFTLYVPPLALRPHAPGAAPGDAAWLAAVTEPPQS